MSLLMMGCICKGGNFGIEFAGGATLQSSHVPLCTLLLFGRLPRLTTKISRLNWERGLRTEFAGGATLQTGHVPICTLPVFGRLPRLTTKISRLYWERGLAERAKL